MNNVLFGFIGFILLSVGLAAALKGIQAISTGVIDQSVIFPLLSITCIIVFSTLLSYQR
jgi:hypothetical protein